MKKLFVLLTGIFYVCISAGQVSPQSGSATFSLPIFDWKDNESRLASSVSLNYTSGSGLKVNEIASNIGQGWRLMGGGIITRIQVGQPDDQKEYNPLGVDIFKRYPTGYLYNTQDISKGCPEFLKKYPIYGHKNQLYAQHNKLVADKELDYFTYEFPGNSGMFIVPRDNDEKVGVFLNDSKMKLWFDVNDNNPLNGIRTTITAFYIQDQEGFIYKFSKYELTRILKYAYFEPSTGRPMTQPDFKEGEVYHEGSFEDNSIHNPKTINSWYLSEIRDPLTNLAITFNYNTTADINAPAGLSLSHYDEKNYSIVSHSTTITETPELSSIQYPDGHQVLIGYGAYRIDLPGARIIRYIDVKYANRYISKYDLTTSYFIRNRYGIPISDFQVKSARLCLLSVKRTGVDLKDVEHPYTFDYYTGSNDADDFVPPPFFYARDIWGYYNGSESRNYMNVPVSLTKNITDLDNGDVKGLCFLRNGASNKLLNAKSGYAKNGLLKQIVFPTGGVLRYEYEQNQFDFGDGLKDAAGVHVARTLVSDGGYSNNCENALVTNYSYKESDGSSSLWGLEMPDNSTSAKQRYSPEYKKLKWKPIANFKCDYKYKYPGILSRDQAVSLTSKQQTMVTLSIVMDVVSAISTAIDIISISLHATPMAIVAVVVDAISTIVGILTTCLDSAPVIDETVIVYSNSDINAMNPLPGQFRRVNITESSGQKGKTIMEFTSPQDPDGEPIWVANNDIQSMVQRFAFWAYGLPKRTIIMDALGNKISETENIYDYPRIMYGDIKYYNTVYLSCKCKVEKSSSIRDVDWSNPAFYDAGVYVKSNNPGDDLRASLYNIYAGRAILLETHEKEFKPGSTSAYISTVTSYSYNYNNYQASGITKTLSNGDIEYKEVKYSADYNAGILQTLKNNNILNTPVSTSSLIRKAGESTTKLLGESVTEFSTIPNGDVRPSRTLEQRFNAPLAPYVIYQGPGHSSNPTYVQTQLFMYNGASELAGIKDEGNRTVYNIYDYNSKYVVASVINASPTTDKVAYTSFETLSFGGWILNGTDDYNTSAYVTGISGFDLSATNSLSTSLTTSRDHTVSFWANNGSVSVSGGSLMKSGPTIDGFTYYEYSVPQGPGTVVVQGSASIDELRSYPSTARMRTITYDPVIGKTSECDENNRITYYEYDNLGKLHFIKDEYGNTIKMYEYNIASYKSSGCTPNFTNKAITEIFTKDDCGSGYIGSTVPYSIPAGRYSSSISQAIADMQAEIELEQLGQSYANTSGNGSCIAVFGNDLQSESFEKENCEPGKAGSPMTYSIPANTYYSTVNKTEANNMAIAEITSNGQAYVNENGSCLVITTPVWETDGEPQFRCELDANNYNTGHQQVLVRDINPNSSSYNQLQWKDAGVSPSCPEPLYKLVRNTLPCSGVTANHTLTAPVGSVVVVKMLLQGVARWDGLKNGMGGKVTISGGNTSSSFSTPHYTTSNDINLNAECNITFTTTASTTSLTTEAIVYNSAISDGGIATLKLVSVDGNPVNVQTNSCAGDIYFYW